MRKEVVDFWARMGEDAETNSRHRGSEGGRKRCAQNARRRIFIFLPGNISQTQCIPSSHHAANFQLTDFPRWARNPQKLTPN